jgi:hypothetical protein
MSTLSIEKSRNLESPAPKKGSAKSHEPSRRKVTSAVAAANKTPRSVESKAARVAAAKTPVKADKPQIERVTKQERVLTLLSRPQGVSLEEMMPDDRLAAAQCAGVLAGTVKKKLGFSLKPNGGVRPYRIETRRAR